MRGQKLPAWRTPCREIESRPLPQALAKSECNPRSLWQSCEKQLIEPDDLVLHVWPNLHTRRYGWSVPSNTDLTELLYRSTLAYAKKHVLGAKDLTQDLGSALILFGTETDASVPEPPHARALHFCERLRHWNVKLHPKLKKFLPL